MKKGSLAKVNWHFRIFGIRKQFCFPPLIFFITNFFQQNSESFKTLEKVKLVENLPQIYVPYCHHYYALRKHAYSNV